MKILVDGQTLGTEELKRGIGKVFLELLHEMLDGDVRHDWFVAIRDKEHLEGIKPSLRRFIKPVILEPLSARGEQIEWCRAFGRQLRDVAASLQADVYWNPNPLMPNVHYPLGFERCPVVTTLHDLIPRVMPERFRPQMGEALWRDYLERCRQMGGSNCWVVGVSEASCEDFRRLEPTAAARLRCVYHASNYSRFWPYQQGDRLSDPSYVLYVGGFDPRKNMDEALRAFAAFVASPDRANVRFKVVCAYDRESYDRYYALARTLGVERQLDLLGYVTDDELGFLFRGASVFFFPSLYEGFGLPVLDALACGVPVVASETSSIPEIAGEHVVYCDPMNVANMAHALRTAWDLRDPDHPRRTAAVAHAREFRWEKSARQYLDILCEAGAAGAAAAAARSRCTRRRPRVAYLSPWPPQKTGVASYSYHLMPELLARMDVTLFVETPEESLPMAGLEIRNIDQYPALAGEFDSAIYHLGNGLTHIKIYEHAWRIPGVIVLHDFNIHPFFHHGFLGHPREALYEEALTQYGAEGREAWAHYRLTGERPEVWQFPMCHPIARRSRATIVHSRWVGSRLEQVDNLVRIHHGAQPDEVRREQADEREVLAQLAPDMDTYWIGVFGFINRHKRVDSVLAAAGVLVAKGFPVRVLIVGEVNDDRVDLAEAARRAGIADFIHHVGYVTEKSLLQYLRAVDVVCNLRYPTMGESSGTLFHSLAAGKATVVSDCGSFSEIPDRCAWKVDPESLETEHLAALLEAMLKGRELRATLGANGRRLIQSRASLQDVAQSYFNTVLRCQQINTSSECDEEAVTDNLSSTGLVPAHKAVGL